MNNCIFCKIITREIPGEIVYESDTFIGLLDINPVNLGHTLLIPKTHHETLFDLPSELLPSLGKELQTLAQKVRSATQADGINIGMNNYASAGQIIPHAHIHVIPRFETDTLKHWPAKSVSKEELSSMGEKIRNS